MGTVKINPKTLEFIRKDLFKIEIVSDLGYDLIDNISDLINLRITDFEFNVRRLTTTETSCPLILTLVEREDMSVFKYLETLMNYEEPFNFNVNYFNTNLKRIFKISATGCEIKSIKLEGNSNPGALEFKIFINYKAYKKEYDIW